MSFRDVEEMLSERHIVATSETIRQWFLKFGTMIAVNLRKMTPGPNARWHHLRYGLLAAARR